MSYTLDFIRDSNEERLFTEQFIEYFSGRDHYDVEGNQAIYQNEDTGVYFVFDYESSEPDETEVDSSIKCCSQFELNYVRPRIFALEAEHEISSFIQHFEVQVRDDQINGMGTGAYSKEGFFQGWETGNMVAIMAIIKSKENRESLLKCTLPSDQIFRIWQWNMNNGKIQSSLSDDIFVPKISFLKDSSGIQTYAVWADAIPSVIPEVDMIILFRDKLAPRKLLRKKQDMIIMPFSEIPVDLMGMKSDINGASCYIPQHGSPDIRVKDYFINQSPGTLSFEGISIDQVLDLEITQIAIEKLNNET